MNKSAVCNILSCAFFTIAVFEFADKGITTLAIVSMGLGATLLCLANTRKGSK